MIQLLQGPQIARIHLWRTLRQELENHGISRRLFKPLRSQGYENSKKCSPKINNIKDHLSLNSVIKIETTKFLSQL